jgi:hypothetical protein
MSKYLSKIFPEGKIIVEYLHGFISWGDVIEMKTQETLQPGYNPHYNLITDVRDVEIDINDLDGMKKYVDFFNYHLNAVGDRKTAILTKSSQQVIHSEMLKMMVNQLPMDLKTVSTYEAAFDWTRLNTEYRGIVLDYFEKMRLHAVRA